jgi:hypothetical protein
MDVDCGNGERVFGSLACDGVADCSNGADEGPALCDLDAPFD